MYCAYLSGRYDSCWRCQQEIVAVAVVAVAAADADAAAWLGRELQEQRTQPLLRIRAETFVADEGER